MELTLRLEHREPYQQLTQDPVMMLLGLVMEERSLLRGQCLQLLHVALEFLIQADQSIPDNMKHIPAGPDPAEAREDNTLGILEKPNNTSVGGTAVPQIFPGA